MDFSHYTVIAWLTIIALLSSSKNYFNLQLTVQFKRIKNNKKKQKTKNSNKTQK